VISRLGWLAAPAVLAAAALGGAVRGAPPSGPLLADGAAAPRADQGCPAPVPARWGVIRDSAWPLLHHVPGDQAWAHLDPAGLPGASATWCNPLAGSQEALGAGAQLYLQHCATCHGVDGHIDSATAAQADPKPYDFTRPEFAGMSEPPGPAVCFAILTRGIDGTMMRAHADVLSAWERLAVLAYVATLPGPAAVADSRAWVDTLAARRARAAPGP